MRLSILAWGLGEGTLGNRGAALGWLGAEVIGLGLVFGSVYAFADTTWYLVPFLAGIAFIVTWLLQAVRVYRRAQRMQAARPPTPRGSPAAAVVLLSVPLLLWGTGFWLIGADGTSPGAVLNRFVAEWPTLASGQTDWAPSLAADPPALTDAAAAALADLRGQCAAGKLNSDCRAAPANLLHDVRLRITTQTDTTATAVPEAVAYRQRPTSVLFLFSGTELVAVPRGVVLQLQLVAVPAPHDPLQLGARRWQIASAERPAS